MIKYYKLFDLLNRRGLKKKDLQQIISAPTIAKLSKGETVKTDIIDKICLFLDCQPGDIMETFKAIEITEKDGTKRTVKLKTSNADEAPPPPPPPAPPPPPLIMRVKSWFIDLCLFA